MFVIGSHSEFTLLFVGRGNRIPPAETHICILLSVLRDRVSACRESGLITSLMRFRLLKQTVVEVWFLVNVFTSMVESLSHDTRHNFIKFWCPIGIQSSRASFCNRHLYLFVVYPRERSVRSGICG